MRCKNCHYSLTGLTEHRCPECGQEFDPDAVVPTPNPVRRHAKRVWTCAFLAIGLALVVLVIQLSSSGPTGKNGAAQLAGFFIVCGLVAIWSYVAIKFGPKEKSSADTDADSSVPLR